MTDKAELVSRNAERLAAFRTLYGDAAPKDFGSPGEHISDAVNRILNPRLRVATWRAADVVPAPTILVFNEVELMLVPGVTTPEMMLETFSAIIEDNSRKWKESPEGIAYAAERAASVAAKQSRLDALLPTMTDAFKTDLSTLRWFAAFSDDADDVDVVVDYKLVVAALKAAGYQSGADIGRPKTDYEDLRVFTSWLAGQAISMLESGMPPHPGLGSKAQSFIEAIDRAAA